MPEITENQTVQRYARARSARDARFDGKFFTAVKSTGIYCRPICPAPMALEKNVVYHDSALSAAQAGYRPCIRCRPDSAPLSPAWLGTETTFKRAIGLIQDGFLHDASVNALANKLGVSDRYLRRLFEEQVGASPKRYALYQQCLFAKKLLQETNMPVNQVAYAAGFNSIRRFNEAIKAELHLTPRQLRTKEQKAADVIELKLAYRPPFDFEAMKSFYAKRSIVGLETVDQRGYHRTISIDKDNRSFHGHLHIDTANSPNTVQANVKLEDPSVLYPVVQNIRRMFDLDLDAERVYEHLEPTLGKLIEINRGLRLPGIWSVFEAATRAVLGQQVTVTAATKLTTELVQNLGVKIDGAVEQLSLLFPTPEAVSNSNLAFLKMPQARKDALRRLAEQIHYAPEGDPEEWIHIKGIGPWTINYAKMRAIKDPDIWLAGDAGLKNALARLPVEFDLDSVSPWKSYATFQLWAYEASN